MQHISRNKVNWPISKKYEYIESNAASLWMLVKNQNVVILRRFSPKEDIRRVTASPYICDIKANYIGIENHLNYIYCPNHSLTESETKGLSAYLNSIIVEKYFRDFAGSTQINARELKSLPYPTRDQLSKIGVLVDSNMELHEIDEIVSNVLKISSRSVCKVKSA